MYSNVVTAIDKMNTYLLHFNISTQYRCSVFFKKKLCHSIKLAISRVLHFGWFRAVLGFLKTPKLINLSVVLGYIKFFLQTISAV